MNSNSFGGSEERIISPMTSRKHLFHHQENDVEEGVLNQHPHQSFINLDPNPHCTPSQFEEQWKLLLPSESFQNIKIRRVPEMEECCHYFTKRRVYTVASGVQGKTNRIFLMSQAQMIKFLVEMKINTKSSRFSVSVKSNDPSSVPSFLQVLELNRLFEIKQSITST